MQRNDGSGVSMLMVEIVARQSRGQLKNGSRLTFYQAVDLYDLSVGKLQRIMLDVGIIQVDLTEAGDRIIHARLAKNSHAENFGAESAIMFDDGVKGEFRSGKQANCHLRRVIVNDEPGSDFTDGSEATRV
ncbi:hypothetical protein NWI01_23220 [Nitrobacter winogradskyi]|uniref:Uncharacterized protein n=1 Tax=Nitrobacter winogradskyi TaxID=913 RepID=A0A4Y3WEA8_NITWI|nr:hypothetical protein NWI01_23220 [Nitrobacter winogradskyi]